MKGCRLQKKKKINKIEKEMKLILYVQYQWYETSAVNRNNKYQIKKKKIHKYFVYLNE